MSSRAGSVTTGRRVFKRAWLLCAAPARPLMTINRLVRLALSLAALSPGVAALSLSVPSLSVFSRRAAVTVAEPSIVWIPQDVYRGDTFFECVMNTRGRPCAHLGAQRVGLLRPSRPYAVSSVLEARACRAAKRVCLQRNGQVRRTRAPSVL